MVCGTFTTTMNRKSMYSMKGGTETTGRCGQETIGYVRNSDDGISGCPIGTRETRRARGRLGNPTTPTSASATARKNTRKALYRHYLSGTLDTETRKDESQQRAREDRHSFCQIDSFDSSLGTYRLPACWLDYPSDIVVCSVPFVFGAAPLPLLPIRPL